MTSTNSISKIALVAASLALFASLSFAIAPAHAQSVTFSVDLTEGSTGADVTALQTWLISKGYSIPAGATGYFGMQTKAAVAAFQTANGITPAAGYFGPITRAKVNSMGGGTVGVFPPGCTSNTGYSTTTGMPCSSGTTLPPGCTSTIGYSPTTGMPCSGGGTTPTGPLKGGAGSVDDYSILSSLNNEEVGEGAEDVEVAGLEIDADEGSDLDITAVRLVFNEGTAGSDFEDYASEVSVWFEGKEVARVDADEFTDDNDWTKTISLDGAVLAAGETGELTVAVTGASSLDSDDETDTWTVDFRQVRFVDADGATVSEDPATDTVTFSFESFATSADIELKVSEGEDSVNDARAIAVDDEDETDEVEILSFEIEAEGDSDLSIDDLSIDFTSVGAGVGEIINASELEVDGETYAASTTIASSTATTMTVTYEDLDWVVGAGESITVTVRVDVNDLDGGFTAGDTLVADVNPDDAAWNVEDEEGEDLAAGDKSGTASNEAHSFFADGLNITDGAAEPTPDTDDTNGDTAGGKRGLFTVEFEVTAFGDPIYIPFGATVATSSVDTDDGVAFAVENADGNQIALNGVGLASTTAAVSSSADTSGEYYVIEEGETETFTLEVTLTPAADGYFRVQFYGVNFNVGSAAAADTLQTATPSADHETAYVNIDV